MKITRTRISDGYIYEGLGVTVSVHRQGLDGPWAAYSKGAVVVVGETLRSVETLVRGYIARTAPSPWLYR